MAEKDQWADNPARRQGELGQPETVGELRSILSRFSDQTKLAVRNAPLMKFYLLDVAGESYVEIDLPDVGVKIG